MSRDDVIALKRENGILREAVIVLAPLAFDVLSVDGVDQSGKPIVCARCRVCGEVIRTNAAGHSPACPLGNMELGGPDSVFTVGDCPRCGKDHGKMCFFKMSGSDSDYWTFCPVTGDPVLYVEMDFPDSPYYTVSTSDKSLV